MKHSLIEPLEARIAPASLSIAPQTDQTTEGDSGTHLVTFVVTLDNTGQVGPITVDYSTIDGPGAALDSATAGSDYDTTSGMLTFDLGAPNQQTFTVAVHGDTIHEHNEAFSAVLSNATGGATIGTTQAKITIQDDDAPPTISIASATVAEGNDPNNPNHLLFTVSLSNASSETITATASTVDGSATTADNDYTNTTATLTFAPGETTKTFSVPVIGDTKGEADETMFAKLTNLSSNVTPGSVQATGTITTDDARVSISDVSVIEGAGGSTTNATFTVTFDSLTPNQTVSVDYATHDGTAVSTGTVAAGTKDYVPASGTLTVTADATGHASKTFDVVVNDDTVAENSETFSVVLSNATGGIGINKGVGVGTITSDDASITISPASITEGNLGDTVENDMSFTVTLDLAKPGQVVDVDFATQDGTAISTGHNPDGSMDYTPTNGTLHLIADSTGHITGTIHVPIIGDGITENNETFSVNLSNARTVPVNDGTVSIQTATATGTINDNDPNTLTISNATVVEGDGGHIDAVFVVTLTPAAQGTVTVSYATALDASMGANPAVSDGPLPDYTAASGTLTFAVGETSKTIVVPILGDLVAEGTETFHVLLSGASGASIANNVGVGTIIDNGDAAPKISLAPATIAEGNVGGTSQLTFVATLSAPSQTSVTVDYHTVDGSATTANNDYAAATGTLTFAPGETSKTITVNVTGDTVNEGNETMSAVLSNPSSNSSLASGTATLAATGTILNDDIIATIAATKDFTETDATFTDSMTVTLSDAPVPGSPVTVNFTLAAGSASLTSDVKLHDPAMVSVTFAAGETTKTIPLDIIGDTTNEADEKFTVTLTGATGAVVDVANSVATGTIHDNDPLPTISIANAQITEGDSGSQHLDFTVSLSAASAQEITVKASTVAGTAMAGTDFNAQADHLITFAPGVTTQTFSVDILGDTTDEPTETFQAQLSAPTNATLAAGHDLATGTILDNDLRALSISDASIDEGNTGDIHHLTFTVSIPSAATQDISFFYDTLDGSAKAGTDYVAKTGAVGTIPAGQTSTTITVDVLGNNTPAPNKSMVVKLRNPTAATLADAQGLGTIVDDESSYQLVAVTDTNVEDDASTTPKTVVYKVTRTGNAAALAIPGSVDFTTADGTGANAAKAGSDYVAKSGTLNFAAGQTEKTITIDLRKDVAHENTETFQVMLTGSSGGVLKDANNTVATSLSKTATITDNDPLPTISISSPSVAEGSATGTTNLNFVVSLSAADETQDVTITYQTIDGTAISVADPTHPADFTASGVKTVTIPKGQLSANIVVPVNQDTINEADETFQVKLSSPTGGETFATGGDTGTGTIKNDDAVPTITFTNGTNGNVTLVEGNSGTTPAVFTVQLSAASEQTVTVNVGLGTGTATLGTDFTNSGVPTSLTFAPGETSKTLTYNIVGDTVNEADETFSVILSGAQHASLGANSTLQATATIKNDDIAPVLAINSLSAPEGNSGITDFVFTVTLTGQSDQHVMVDYATADLAAISSGPAPDYHSVKGTLDFAPGETSKTIVVPVNGDTIKEGDESFTVNLSNPTNATIAKGANGTTFATGTILNDGDTNIGVSISDAVIKEGDSGTSTASFTVSLSAASAGTVTVDAATRNGTAVAGSDYTKQKTTISFAPGEIQKTFSVTIKGDTDFEATESYFVNLSNVTGGAQIVDGEGRGTIYNDDLQIVDSQTVRYVDTDGDLATVHISKGVLTTTGQFPVLTFSATNAIGGRTLQKIDFTSDRLGFNHVDLSVTADLQPGYAASGGHSDGRVNVGFIQGGIAQGNLFQLFDNIDFGNINIEGDLGKIVAGDQVATDRAVVNMNVLSHGVLGTSTGAPDNVSIFLGGVGQIVDQGDWLGVLESVGGDTGDIQSLFIKGALRGDSNQASGQIFFTGTLFSATVGSIIGGAGASSGTIFGNLTNDATLNSGSSIGAVHVLGDVVGGAGANSGRIFAPNIGAVTVDGNLVGGSESGTGVIQAGAASLGGTLGSVLIKGDVKGGTGANSANSGEIFGSKSIGSVVVRGSMIGGTGDDSASIVTQGSATAVTVLKSIVGGAGQRSGSVQISKFLTNFQLGVDATHPDGDLIGGTGTNSGTLSVGKDLKTSGVIFGSIKGGTGSASGGVNVNGTIPLLEVGHDLIGGSSSGIAPAVSTSGFIAANRIGSLLIDHDITSGTNGGTSLVGSATVRVTGDIAALVVGGKITGTEDVPVVIAAGGLVAAAKNQTIGALVVRGDTAFADILGGYGGGVSPANPLGTPENPDAQMGTIKLLGNVTGTNVVAGIAAGADGRFGTADDTVITNGTADDPAVQSKIAAFVVKGSVQPTTDIFGVVAQIIAAKNVTGDTHVLDPIKADDFEFAPPNSNFRLHEVSA